MMITIHQRNQKFLWRWHCQQICSKFTSLSSAWQIYHWLAHNSVNPEFAYSLLLIPPIHKYSTVKKMQCSTFTGYKQFTNEQISNIWFPSWCQNPVWSISLFSAESGQTSYRKVPCFANKVLKWYKHVFQIHNFPPGCGQSRIHSSANYIHCSIKLSVSISLFTSHFQILLLFVQLSLVVELWLFLLRVLTWVRSNWVPM